ncbi:peptidylprolyl isomerase [Paracoccus laeviglucosivorans]|uniref:Parvulin-like PPIase n=1 Tax=Paracoccus laeviglucosivorans TaxID=1197861 RepID=A0A521CET8_9RHOB|nr:periplasmic chaperone for outer membrane proteins SurA [Paracoccus laeviglucosivorans]
MRRILLGAAMAAMLAGTAMGPLPGLGFAAMAQGAGNPFQPLLYVNDSAVTRYEVDQRVRFLQLLRAPETDLAAAEQALIDDRLRNFAAKQAGITASDEQINAGLEEFASRGNMGVEQFEQVLRSNGVDRETFRDFVTSGIVWREFVRQRVLGQARVTDAEVDQEMKKIIETPRITSVSLSELIIPAPQGQEARAMALAEDIVSRTRTEGDFASFARQYSATPSAQNGGRLPTAPLANLPPTLRPILLQMQPGQISQPLPVQGAVVLFFLRDTQGTLRPGAREQDLDYMRVRLGSTAEAARLQAVVNTCDDLLAQTSNLPAEQVMRQTVSQGQVPVGDGIRLAVLDDNETTVVSYGGAVDLLMLCKRSPALLTNPPAQAPVATSAEQDGQPAQPNPDALPEREAVRNQLFNRKVGEAADNYLAELRANAIIRRP